MKKIVSVLLILALSLALLIPFGIVAVSADGPILITDQAGLAAMSADGSYKLANDITISGEWENNVIFKGTFDGDGHTITFADGATVHGGLFKLLNQGATIRDLNIVAGNGVTWKLVTDVVGGIGGAGAPCIGGLAASAEASLEGSVKKWEDEYFIQNPQNTITVQNVTVTANIAISGSTGYKDDKVAVGGIIGDVGIISLIKDCVFNGSISDESRAKFDMNAYESGYGGIVGVAIRNGGPVVISGCTNNADITGYAQQGGILGYSRTWAGGTMGIMSLVIQKCVNTGTITCLQTTLGSTANPKRATAGGIVGYAFVKNGAKADLLNNINYGNIVASSAENEKIEAGIVGVLRQKETVTVAGNINFGNARVNVMHTGLSNGEVNYQNNYGEGEGSVQYTPFETLGGLKAVCDALNEAYPDVYVYKDGTIMLAEKTASGSNPSTSDFPNALTQDVTVPEPTGTAITNQKELEAMKADGTYYLANDIELKGSFKSLSGFSGVLHGNGHTIVYSGVELRGGFFKSLAGGKVYNLSFTQAPETSSENNYRGLLSDNESDICFGTVAGYGYGTLVGVTTDCAIGATLNNTSNAYVGGLIGILTDGNTLIYQCRNTGKIEGAIAGGIVGSVSCENGKVEIARCVNWGEVTSSSGTAGGILAAHRLTVMQVAMSLLVLENVNYGTVSTTDSRYCGGVAGSVTSFMGGKASFLRNVNFGAVKANAAGVGCPGGIIGNIGYSGILIAGNLNLGSVSGSGEPNQLVAKVDSNEGVTAENNFAVGTPATVGTAAGASIDANTVATLNGVYADAFAAGDPIALKWAVDANISAAAPTVSYTIIPSEEEHGGEGEDPTPGTSEPVTQAPAGENGNNTATPGTSEPAPETKIKKGCGSAIGIGGIVALLMLGGAGAAVAVRRKED